MTISYGSLDFVLLANASVILIYKMLIWREIGVICDGCMWSMSRLVCCLPCLHGARIFFCCLHNRRKWAVSMWSSKRDLTYLLTPWRRVLPEQLTGLQLVKKFPKFHGTRRFITALAIVRHLSLSWANPIQSIYPHPTSWWSILILSTHLHLGLPSGLFPTSFPTKTL